MSNSRPRHLILNSDLQYIVVETQDVRLAGDEVEMLKCFS